MRIGIDARLWKETTGRYIRNLVKELSKLDEVNNYVLFALDKDKDEISAVVAGKKNWIIVSANFRWHTISEQIKFPKLLEEFDLDVVHFPYFSVPIFYNKSFVMTLHDLTVNKFNTGRASTLPLPLYAAKRVGYHAVLGSAIKRAKKIIIPSYAVVEDVELEYPLLDKSKLVVTHEGGFEHEPRIMNHEAKIKGKYLLRVGNYYPHKNVEGLIKAFKFLLDERRTANDEQPKLILVGKKDYFYERMEGLVVKLGIGEQVMFLDKIDDDQLVNLYKNATATIVPSFAEGFSLTAIEAMSLGSSVVASDIPVHREVCGDAAIYFDPNKIENIAERIGFALDMVEQSRKKLIEQGEKQAKKFSWEKMAKETLQIYNSAV